MTPTIEEVKKTADVCGARQCRDMVKFTNEQLQAFAQHFKEEGRKEGVNEILAREYGDLSVFETHIRNNTGE